MNSQKNSPSLGSYSLSTPKASEAMHYSHRTTRGTAKHEGWARGRRETEQQRKVQQRDERMAELGGGQHVRER